MTFRRRYLINRLVVLITLCLFVVIVLYVRLSFHMHSELSKPLVIREYSADYLAAQQQQQQQMSSALYKIRNKHLVESKLNEAAENNKLPRFIVILIQVHSRVNYLKELIESLRATRHIQDALVVFSHDLNSPEINKLVHSIDFCATVQIFYPYALELYPDRFPGRDANDCPANLTKTKAILSKCNNAYYPDSYGNYRDASIVQIKHHWLWKLGFIFDVFKETKDIKNLNVLLLEEDYYLMPDALHTLRKLSEKILSDIDIVSLGVFDNTKNHTQQTYMNSSIINMYSKAIFHSSSHNTGLVLARAQWNMLLKCQEVFCTYDDYNWDFSFQYVSQNCFSLPLVSIFPNVSRVVHIGECGTHHKGKNCDPFLHITPLKQNYTLYKEYFFPREFNLSNVNPGIYALKKSNGGWSDPRDHLLCQSFPHRMLPRLDVNLKFNCFLLNGKNYCSNSV